MRNKWKEAGWWKWPVAAFVVLMVIGGIGSAFEGDENSDSNQASPTKDATQVEKVTSTESKPKAESKPEPVSEPVESEPEEPEATASQENAVEAAEGYLDTASFSKSGLEEQLEFESYDKADAKYAVSHVDVDWNEQAVDAAEAYLETSSFSEPALVEQLEFEGFTSSEATYGVSKAYK